MSGIVNNSPSIENGIDYCLDNTHFEMMKLIGKGGFGKVYMVKKITGPDEGKLYAMKVIKKAALKYGDKLRAKKERDILTKISHPFLIKLFYAFQTEGKLFLILELMKGGDMFTMLERETPYLEETAVFYSAELALALHYLHGLGIIYRDLKPENLLIGADGHICLTDFGLSKETDGETNSFCGTVSYMSPELVSGKGHTTATDWWSFGVLTFELLTGSPPFKKLNRKDLITEIMGGSVSFPIYLSEEAQSLIRLLLQKNPSNRLGAGRSGMRRLQRHQFYSTIDWEKLYLKELKPPYLPRLVGEDDTSCFEIAFTREAISNSDGDSITSEMNEIFQGFEYETPNFNSE